MNIAEARRRNDENTACPGAVGAIAAKIMEEQAPPEVRLLNDLLRAKPDDRARLLEEHRDLVTDQFVTTIQQMRQVLGRGNREMADQLAQIEEQVAQLRDRDGEGS